MKFGNFSIIFALLFNGVQSNKEAGSNVKNEQNSSKQQRHSLRGLSDISPVMSGGEKCKLLLRVSRGADEQTHLKEACCEFADGIAKITSDDEEGTQAYFLSKFESGEIKSGQSYLSIQNTTLSQDLTEMKITNTDMAGFLRENLLSEETSLVGGYPPRKGTFKLLVLRVLTGSGSQIPPSDENKLSDKWFGTFGDPVNNKSQFKACSNNQIFFEPFIGTTSTGVNIANGVYTITVSADQYNAGLVENQARSVGSAVLGSLSSQFDYVALSLPDNSEPWAARAYINGWLSMYKKHNIDQVTVQMHELGHNLGLPHSGEGSNEYGDHSGVMGNLFFDDRNICFNGPKNAQLGWYQDREVDIDPTVGFDGDLYGIADYSSTGSSAKMILQIGGIKGKDYYITFNKATGINSGTNEGANKVLVHSRKSGTGYFQSYLLAELSAGENFYVEPLNIEVLSISATARVRLLPPATCDPTNACVANGDQYCCLGDTSSYSECAWDINLDLTPITKLLAPGTKCCQTPYGNRITQQHIFLPCPVFDSPPKCKAVIENGVIRLGIDGEGSLINCGAGLTYKDSYGTWQEVLNWGTLSEAFGASAKVDGASFHGGASSSSGISNLDTAIPMEFTKSTAKTIVKVTGEPLKITHDFQPSTKTDNLYEISVIYENLSATKTLTDLRYRRVMDFDVPPNIFDECISIFYSGGTNPKYLEYAHNNGFLDVNPTSNVSGNTLGLGPCPGNCPSGGKMDYGPKDQGALFNLFFGNVSIPPGGKFDFKIYYGAAETKTAADAAVNAVGATMGAYAFNAVGGSCSASDGSNPGVFIFAFSEGPPPCELPPGGCVANGDQYCCANDDSRFNVCTWDNNLNLYPITMPVAPGTKCCQSPWGNTIIQQHHLMSCPA